MQQLIQALSLFKSMAVNEKVSGDKWKSIFDEDRALYATQKPFFFMFLQEGEFRDCLWVFYLSLYFSVCSSFSFLLVVFGSALTLLLYSLFMSLINKNRIYNFVIQSSHILFSYRYIIHLYYYLKLVRYVNKKKLLISTLESSVHIYIKSMDTLVRSER